MGCDFSWRGIVPQRSVQQRCIRFLSPLLYAPNLVTAEPGRRVRALFVTPFLSGDDRLEAAYPFDFYGLIPFRDVADLDDREQFVFDRSDGGRLVTVLPALPHDLDQWGAELRVKSGGSTRHLTGSATSFALLLNVLRIRYCPDLDVSDDYGITREVALDIDEWGLTPVLKDESCEWPVLQQLYRECEARREKSDFERLLSPQESDFRDDFDILRNPDKGGDPPPTPS